MQKQDVLKSLSVGARIAEDEEGALASYFVETDQWSSVYGGQVDVIYGPKGSGKSAIYSLLLSRSTQLFDSGILVKAAENPRGAPAFKDLESDPPTSEQEFRELWKLYLLCLLANVFEDYGINNQYSQLVKSNLQTAKLIPNTFSLRTVLFSALDYIRRLTRPETYEGGVNLDPSTGLPSGFYGKISLHEPTAVQQEHGIISIDQILNVANRALEKEDYSVWLLVDRLDVAFAENLELERNGLRALFRVYLDLQNLKSIKLKIFLRNDIWLRIAEEGFREASHITRDITLQWTPDGLLNLTVRRLLHNNLVKEYYAADPNVVLANYASQEELFYKIFPDQPEVGEKKRLTFKWMLSRTADGSGENAPRELIHFLDSLRRIQLQRFERGQADPPDQTLFDRVAFKDALPEVSRVRLEQTLYAEHPKLKKSIQQLERQKTEQTVDSLREIWKIPDEKAYQLADELVEVGFFKKNTSTDSMSYWVPFLYRPTLNMSQGSAE